MNATKRLSMRRLGNTQPPSGEISEGFWEKLRLHLRPEGQDPETREEQGEDGRLPAKNKQHRQPRVSG